MTFVLSPQRHFNISDTKFAVILEHFDQVVGDCFMDCVNCLIGFANSKSSPRISLMAIALLRICEDRLAEVFLFAQYRVTCLLSENSDI